MKTFAQAERDAEEQRIDEIRYEIRLREVSARTYYSPGDRIMYYDEDTLAPYYATVVCDPASLDDINCVGVDRAPNLTEEDGQIIHWSMVAGVDREEKTA